MIHCNGFPGLIAWGSVIALAWLALCIPAPRLGWLGKAAAVGVFGWCVFWYLGR